MENSFWWFRRTYTWISRKIYSNLFASVVANLFNECETCAHNEHGFGAKPFAFYTCEYLLKYVSKTYQSMFSVWCPVQIQFIALLHLHHLKILESLGRWASQILRALQAFQISWRKWTTQWKRTKLQRSKCRWVEIYPCYLFIRVMCNDDFNGCFWINCVLVEVRKISSIYHQ